jgi:hypothetical protein
MVPTEKTLKPCLPSLTGRSTAHSATTQPEGGAQDTDPGERVGHNEVFLTKYEIRPRDLEVLFRSLNHYTRGPFATQPCMKGPLDKIIEQQEVDPKNQ